MKNAVLAGALYFLVAFAAGFALGVVRNVVLAPVLGELGAILVELPVILGISWIACGALVRRFRVAPDGGARLAMGAVAFALLIGAELALGMAAFGRPLEAQIEAWTGPAGMAGLAGQVLFALFPLLRRRG